MACKCSVNFIVAVAVGLAISLEGRGSSSPLGDWTRVEPPEIEVKEVAILEWTFSFGGGSPKEWFTIAKWEGNRIALIPAISAVTTPLLIRRKPSLDRKIRETREGKGLLAYEFRRIKDLEETMANLVIEELEAIDDAKDREFLKSGRGFDSAPRWDDVKKRFELSSRLRELREPTDLLGNRIALNGYDDFPRLSRETYARFRKIFERRKKECSDSIRPLRNGELFRLVLEGRASECASGAIPLHGGRCELRASSVSPSHETEFPRHGHSQSLTLGTSGNPA